MTRAHGIKEVSNISNHLAQTLYFTNEETEAQHGPCPWFL